MLPDVRMVQMYSKSANVNDLGFAWDRLVPLFAWTSPPPCSYSFSARWFAMPFRDTLHHPYICPCFWRKHFYTLDSVCLFDSLFTFGAKSMEQNATKLSGIIKWGFRSVLHGLNRSSCSS